MTRFFYRLIITFVWCNVHISFWIRRSVLQVTLFLRVIWSVCMFPDLGILWPMCGHFNFQLKEEHYLNCGVRGCCKSLCRYWSLFTFIWVNLMWSPLPDFTGDDDLSGHRATFIAPVLSRTTMFLTVVSTSLNPLTVRGTSSLATQWRGRYPFNISKCILELRLFSLIYGFYLSSEPLDY